MIPALQERSYIVPRSNNSQVWWQVLVISALCRWKQEDQEFKSFLVYLASLRIAWAT